jgi:hypothetical protein
MSAAVVFVDTETTSLDRHRRRIWEVGLIRHEDGQRAELQFFIDPIDLSDADPASLRIGRFYERHPWGVKLSNTEVTAEAYEEMYGHVPMLLSPALAAVKIAEWTHGAHLIGAVPSFDEESMAALLREHNQAPSWHYHLVDIENMMAGFLLGEVRTWAKVGTVVHGGVDGDERSAQQLLPPWESVALGQQLGIGISERDRHTALGDARWAERCWLAMYGEAAAVEG